MGLHLRSQGRWIMAKIDLPSPYVAEDVDVGSIRLNAVVFADPDWMPDGCNGGWGDDDDDDSSDGVRYGGDIANSGRYGDDDDSEDRQDAGCRRDSNAPYLVHSSVSHLGVV